MFFGQSAQGQDVITHVDGDGLDKLLTSTDSKYQFIDVRTPEEFGYRNVKGFKNIPLQVLDRFADELNKEEPVVIICASGSRSMSAASYLKSVGFTNIINVRGGISFYRG